MLELNTRLTVSEVRQILEQENLRYYSLFGDGEKRPDEVALVEKDGGFLIYETDESSVVQYSRKFKNQSEALRFFLDRVRITNKVLNDYADEQSLLEKKFEGKKVHWWTLKPDAEREYLRRHSAPPNRIVQWGILGGAGGLLVVLVVVQNLLQR